MKKIFLPFVGFLLLFAVSGCASGTTSSASSSSVATSAVSSVNMSSWKTYTNAGAHVTFRYPAAWKGIVIKTNGAPYQQEQVSGAEGSVNITWGTGLGGACSENGQEKALESMTFNGQQYDVCHTTTPGESWRLISKTIGQTDISLDVYATPSAGSSQVLQSVLSTLVIK